MKKKLSRNCDRLTIFLNEEFAIPIVDEESHPRRDRYYKNVATACSTPLTLKTDCMKCVNRRSLVRELADSYKKLKSKHCKYRQITEKSSVNAGIEA